MKRALVLTLIDLIRALQGLDDKEGETEFVEYEGKITFQGVRVHRVVTGACIDVIETGFSCSHVPR